MSAPVRTRRPRGSIDPDIILHAALDLARATDVDSVSMPAIAERLGVGATSIYWHYRSKDDLLRAMSGAAIHLVWDRLPEPEAGTPWRAYLERHFRAMRAIYRDDDMLADLVLFRIRSYSLDATHVLFQRIEGIVAMLVASGFRPITAWHAYSTLSTFTRGIIVAERSQRLNHSPAVDERHRRLLVPQTMPHLTALLDGEGIALAMVSDDDFEWALARILDGCARLRESER
jgi:AcrR family transcriptional regulator